MWNRKDVKDYAKDFLRKHYWKAFIVCLIVAIVTGGAGTNSTVSNRGRYNNINVEYNSGKIPMEINNPIGNYFLSKVGISPFVFLGVGTIIIFGILFLVLFVTVGYALEVGRARFFLKGFKDDVDIGKLFSTFNTGEYFNVVKTMFIKNLYLIGWTLLFIIPGVIKSYEYRMVPYIVAEDPSLGADEAIQKSRDMTYGHKSDLFVLDLSFIGWNLLGMLLFGIGVLFVIPYVEATNAKVYNVISGNDTPPDLY